MQPSIETTAFDLRCALLRGVKLQELEAQVLRRMKLPAPGRTAAGPLYLLQQTAPDLAELVQQWMSGDRRPAQKGATSQGPPILAAASPRGIDVPAYIKQLCPAGPPAVIAVDASPAEVGAALHYGCSLHYGLQAAVRVAHLHKKHTDQELEFQPGDFLCELAVWCLQTKTPLIPLGMQQRLVASEFQFLYNRMMAETQDRFSHEARHTKDPAALEQLATALARQVFGSGFNLMVEREDLITRSCYLASRLLDLGQQLAATGYRHETVLMFYKMQLSLDLPPLARMFFSSPAAVAEMYQPLEPQPAGAFRLRALVTADEALPGGHHFAHGARMQKTIEKLLSERLQEQLSPGQTDELCAQVAYAVRRHPLVERPAGVRGTLAMREIAQGLGLIRGNVTREALAKAAFVALPHRIRLVQGDDICMESLLKSILSRAVFGIPLFSEDEELAHQERRPLTPEELARALQGLTDAAFRQLGPEEALPTSDPGFAHEAMNHPLVQQALKDAMEKGLGRDSFDDYKDLLSELEDRDLLSMADASRMTLSDEGRQKLEDHARDAFKKGELTAEELAEALKNSRSMPAPPGLAPGPCHVTGPDAGRPDPCAA